MANLEDLELFVMISELDGLTPAARAMSITPAAASQALKRLETRLGARLFNRTTRSLELTPEGVRYLETAQHALRILADGKRSLNSNEGTLRLTAPSDLGRSFLISLLTKLKESKPNIHIKLSLTDKVEDLLSFKYDAALRFGGAISPDFIVLSVIENHRYVTCASPEYLLKYGTPITPSQLSHHECIINYSSTRPENFWRFYSEGKTETVQIKGGFENEDGDVTRRWALAGNGIANLPLLNVVDDFRTGDLYPILQNWEGERLPLNLIVSHRSQLNDSMRSIHKSLMKICNEKLEPYNTNLIQ